MVQINGERSGPRTILHMIRYVWLRVGERSLLDTLAMRTRFHFTLMLGDLDRHRREIEHLTDIDLERLDFTQRSPTSLTHVHAMDDTMIWMFHLTERRSMMSFLSTWLFAR